MSEKSVMKCVSVDAVRSRGTQADVAGEAGMDGAVLSKVLSGEGSIKLEALEKIFVMAGVRVITEQEHTDNESLLRIFARRLLS